MFTNGGLRTPVDGKNARSKGHSPQTDRGGKARRVVGLVRYGVGESVPVGLADIVVAERMRNEEPGLGFDSLHAAVSKRLGHSLLSSEGVYGRLGLPVIDLDELRTFRSGSVSVGFDRFALRPRRFRLQNHFVLMPSVL